MLTYGVGLIAARLMNRSRTGRGIRAVAQDMDTARLMGVNVDLIILITFLVGGLMAGAAAFFFEIYNGTARYSLGFELGVKAFTAAVLGGIGSLPGAVIGGLVGAAIFAKWRGYPIARGLDIASFGVMSPTTAISALFGTKYFL